MNIVAISKNDGHVFESQPYTEANKEAVIRNLHENLANAGLTTDLYDVAEMSDEELNVAVG